MIVDTSPRADIQIRKYLKVIIKSWNLFKGVLFLYTRLCLCIIQFPKFLILNLRMLR